MRLTLSPHLERSLNMERGVVFCYETRSYSMTGWIEWHEDDLAFVLLHILLAWENGNDEGFAFRYHDWYNGLGGIYLLAAKSLGPGHLQRHTWGGMVLGLLGERL